MLALSPATLAASALAASTLAAGATLAHAVFAPRSGLLMPVLSRGRNPSAPTVALTFDDGPFPGVTDRVLDILAARRVAATFFVIGRAARQSPDLLRRAHAEGHTIGNHTFNHHRDGAFRSRAYWRSELAQANDAIAGIIQQSPALFRPPMGIKTPAIAHAARALNLTTVTWSRRARDGVASSTAAVVRRAAQRAAPADVILLHDGRDAASRRDPRAILDSLPRILDTLERRNLRVVPLTDLLDIDAYRSASDASSKETCSSP